MKHVVAGLGSLAVLVVAAASLAQTDGWKEYVYTGDGFAIAAPSEPARNAQPIYVTGGTADAHVYTSAAGSNAALMLFVFERHNNDRRSVQQIHANAQDDALGPVKGNCAPGQSCRSGNIEGPSSSSRRSIRTWTRKPIRCAADTTWSGAKSIICWRSHRLESPSPPMRIAGSNHSD
jgi:hypothetical protein